MLNLSNSPPLATSKPNLKQKIKIERFKNVPTNYYRFPRHFSIEKMPEKRPPNIPASWPSL